MCSARISHLGPVTLPSVGPGRSTRHRKSPRRPWPKRALRGRAARRISRCPGCRARVADLKADKRMEGIRLIRWLVSPWPTFTMWRRMTKWEIRSYEHAVEMERRGVIYRELLAHEYGPRWRKQAPAAERLPLKLAGFGEMLPALNVPATDLLRKYAPQPEAL